MGDIRTATPTSRARLWGVKEALPTSPSGLASDLPSKRKAYGALSSARASALIAAVDQRAFPTLKQPPSGDSRNWLRASLIFSLLALLSIAGSIAGSDKFCIGPMPAKARSRFKNAKTELLQD
jgi:hypothetical protein